MGSKLVRVADTDLITSCTVLRVILSCAPPLMVTSNSAIMIAIVIAIMMRMIQLSVNLGPQSMSGQLR